MWETRVDYKEKPRVLASLPAGTIVLVYLDDLAFPPNASAEVREATEADIAGLLSRQNKEVAADSAPGQFGTICAWIRLGASWRITEEEVANMGGWRRVENMTLLKKERLVFHGDPGSCRWVTKVEEAGLLRYPIAMTEKTLEQRGLFWCPSKAVLNLDRYHVSGQSNTLMAHQPKQSKSGIDRYSIPLWSGGGNGA